MMKPTITLPDNAKALIEKAKATIAAKKAALLGNKAEAQQILVNAKIEAEKAERKLREISEQEAQTNKEAEALELRRRTEQAERLRKAEEITKAANTKAIKDGERMKAVQALAKKRGDTLTFEGEVEGENMDTVSPFSLMALSPQGACEQYEKVRLNTIRNMMSKINRRLAKAVATRTIVKVKEKKVRPNASIDILCLFTQEMREDMMKLYEQKGWDVTLEGDTPKKFTYVFQPKPVTG